VGTTVNFTGTFTDNAGDTHTGNWTFDAINKPATIVEASGTANTSYMFNTAGVYAVTLTITDDCGNATTATTVSGLTAMIVVYDPSGGFVTGGGWINSPAGAYVPNPSLIGKANFGFVSKYKRGATIPEGETEFQFQMAGLNFHSTSYEWLVISGAKAQYKGAGTINGVSGYTFLLTATDGQVNGGGGVDKFRIKIWNSGGIVYDNAPGPDDIDTSNQLAIGGGSIVIHK
jgi:PKD repeat protein